MFRAKKVAAVFDFDKTLAPEYMQYVIFQEYNIDEEQFWRECQAWSNENIRLLGSNHSELSYMNMFLKYVEEGRMPGLTNAKLQELGKGIRLYPGVEDLFITLHRMGVEIYIVSSGISMLLASLEDRIRAYGECPEFKIHKIYGGDFREDPKTGLIHSVASVVSPLDKLKAIYEISKGCNIYGFDYTVSIPKDQGGRRVPLEYLIYVGDGQSDVPAMNLVCDSGGFTLGVYNPDVPTQFQQIERIRSAGRLSSIAVADYRPGTTAHTILVNKAQEFLYKISEEYEFRQSLNELRNEGVVPIHPWTSTKL